MSAQLGLGLAALGRPGYMTVGHAADVPDATEAGLEAQALAVMDEAYRLGVRHVDTARSYGQAEAFLARWLERRGIGDVIVSTKWGYRYTAGWARDAPVHEVKDHSAATFEAQLAESRALLGPAMTIHQVHSLTPDSPLRTDEALIDRLAHLRDEGVEVGVSVSGPRQAELIDWVLGVRRDGRPVFGAVQATWNALERSAGPMLLAARRDGRRVIVKEGLANGRLGPNGDVPAWREACAAKGVSSDVGALALILAQPFASVVLSGAATVSQLRSNAEARSCAIAPDWMAELALAPEAFWRQRAQLKWT